MWKPQPGPQTALLKCPTFEVLYGGARGGGKTDGMLGDFAQHAQMYGKHASGVFFRREYRQLEQVIERAQALFMPLGAAFNKTTALFRFPNGAVLRFRHLWDVAAASAYQGHEYSWICFEELTNWPDPAPVNMLRATLRSSAGVRVSFRATGNPGGPGHTWVKARYIDPAPHGYAQIQDEETGQRRVFIPAKLEDNPMLVQNDPTYEARLRESGSAELVRAWRWGDWDVVVGAYFDCWRADKHVVQPRRLPDHWTRFRAMDWGSARPFSVGWYAVSDGTLSEFPRGALIRYREWYGCEGPNVGIKMSAEEVGRGIAAREREDSKIHYGVIDPSAFRNDGGPSIAERMNKYLRPAFLRADNARVPQAGAMGGWDQVRARLTGPDGTPMLYVFSTGVHLIRTLPALQHDQRRIEDVDTDGEDHAPDELRYACMSRPFTKDDQRPDAAINIRQPTFNEAFKQHQKALAKGRARDPLAAWS